MKPNPFLALLRVLFCVFPSPCQPCRTRINKIKRKKSKTTAGSTGAGSNTAGATVAVASATGTATVAIKATGPATVATEAKRQSAPPHVVECTTNNGSRHSRAKLYELRSDSGSWLQPPVGAQLDIQRPVDSVATADDTAPKGTIIEIYIHRGEDRPFFLSLLWSQPTE